MKKRKKGCVIAALIFGYIIFVIAAGTFYYFDVLLLKGDNFRTRGNLSQIYKRLEQYHTEHGAYPDQQDMNSLLKTLGMNDNDFVKVLFLIFILQNTMPPIGIRSIRLRIWMILFCQYVSSRIFSAGMNGFA